MRTGPLWLLAACLWMAGCGRPPELRTETGAPDAPAIYRTYCLGCHGPDGKRGKPAMHLSRAAGRPPPEVEGVIREGGKGMPAWKDRLKPDEIAAVAEYARRLGRQAR